MEEDLSMIEDYYSNKFGREMVIAYLQHNKYHKRKPLTDFAKEFNLIVPKVKLYQILEYHRRTVSNEQNKIEFLSRIKVKDDYEDTHLDSKELFDEKSKSMFGMYKFEKEPEKETIIIQSKINHERKTNKKAR